MVIFIGRNLVRYILATKMLVYRGRVVKGILCRNSGVSMTPQSTGSVLKFYLVRLVDSLPLTCRYNGIITKVMSWKFIIFQ